MRKKEEVIKQILDFANEDERVRAVMLNGSRVNPNAPKDLMQDYDVIFFITDIENISYKINRQWINRFGETVIIQQNDFEDGSYVFLMQFKDGVRIDLNFKDILKIEKTAEEDSLSKILLDKDDIAPIIHEANDSSYFVNKPSKNEFDKAMNNLWWIQTYVAKGIWRDELPLAKYMFDVILIDGIHKLLYWNIGIKHDWKINVGKCGRWFNKFLPDEIYKEFISLYPTIDYDQMWESLFAAGSFIRKIGTEVSENLGYTYPKEEDMNVSEYIRKIKELPKDAIDF